MRTVEELRQDIDRWMVTMKGAVRRMAVTLAGGALWQVLGVRTIDGKGETRQAEPFTGIGFYSVPSSSGKPEAVVLFVGDANSPVIAALRDEATRAAIAGNFQPDETGIFNTQALVYVKADGTIEARLASGAAVPLALKTDVEAVDSKYATHIHADSTTAPTSVPQKQGSILPNGSPPPTYEPGTDLDPADIVGTTVLKGQ